MNDDRETVVRIFTSMLNTFEDKEIKIADLQAKIDMLMLEYCPNAMTEEQIIEYNKHQKPVVTDGE